MQITQASLTPSVGSQDSVSYRESCVSDKFDDSPQTLPNWHFQRRVAISKTPLCTR